MPAVRSEANKIFDILILGAGISGIGLAAYLRRNLPGKSWQILEMRDDLGGTWDLFRYPGIRSDSDLYTFAYEFKPWESRNSIAEAGEIKAYIGETAEEYDILDRIGFGRRVLACDWSSDEAAWTVTTERTADGLRESWCARWIFSATGYYDYAEGYRPDFPDEGAFEGRIVHPQAWPADFDHAGKRIAVIGSGATAVTLVPALAGTAAHVTQIQRTPTYVLPLPREEPLLKLLAPVFSKVAIHRILRRKNILRQHVFYALCRRFPGAMRKFIRRVNRRFLPADFPVDTHFNPPYDPWDQRLCFVPGADLFRCLADGSCSIVSGRIRRFVADGVEMEDGTRVQADIIVTATGLNLKLMGGARYSVDGVPVDWAERVVFKGMMLDGIPNFAMSVGYTTSSWTLKVGLVCEYLCRLLAEMDLRQMAVCTPERPEHPMELRPLLDFGAGYVKRSVDHLPRQGDRFPWVMTFDYGEDAKMFRRGRVVEPELRLAPVPAGLARAAE